MMFWYRISRRQNMAIRRVIASTSFRIVTLFASLFILGGMFMTVTSGLYSQSTLRQQIRREVENEGHETFADAGVADVRHLLPVVQGLVEHEPGFHYLLQDPGQVIVAGNMLHLRPLPGERWLAWSHRLPRETNRNIVYGIGYILDDGGYYFVGIDASSLTHLQHALWTTILWEILGFGFIGIAGGLFLSSLILKWIETISLTARSIMQGDMSRRIPLRGTNDELDHLSESLNAMLDQNESLIASLKQVSNDIAHDMRLPLARMRQNLERAILAHAPSDTMHEQVEFAIEDLDAALEIFSSLLKLAQLESGAWKNEMELLDPAQLLKSVLEPYRSVIDDHGQYLATEIIPACPTITGHSVLLRQAFSNLIENAIRHTPGQTTVSATLTSSDNSIHVEIADNGPGIPAEAMLRVFDRFFRLDTSRTHDGNGLGLSMVKAIVRLHAGSIILYDNNPGLRCVIKLPIKIQ
ncbi:sensor histidine kinase [Komagataeibacter oboediens]|uniref:sensor histidine kinase n=1 Tax=Komagataeibacter oboediens TaxID=65958 RepID=UPI000237E207|nr:HAMP domain-containing sensor histidine kinase [Komagataeibacter oboediens]